jgi:hypothetical protein
VIKEFWGFKPTLIVDIEHKIFKQIDFGKIGFLLDFLMSFEIPEIPEIP